MKRVLGLTGLVLFLVSSGAAVGELSVSGFDLPENITAGSSYSDNVSVSYSGETSVVVDMVLGVSAESTDSEGLVFEASPDRFILEPGSPRMVVLSLDTSHGLVRDNFSFSVAAETEFEVVESDSGGSGGSAGTIVVGDDDSGDEGSNDSVVVRNVTLGELNESEEDDLVERIEGLENSSEERSEVIEDLKGNLSAESAESSYWRTQFTNLRFGVLITVVLLVAGVLGKRFGPVVRERFYK